MPEYSTRRVLLVAAIAGAVVGGAVASGVAEASTGGGGGGSTASAGGGSVGTARVVRTDLTTTVQVGGSIGYQGSFTIAFPAGASAQQVAQARQAVAMDQQSLGADQTAEADSTASDDQAVAAAQIDVDSAAAALGSDQAAQARDCSGKGATTPACSQDDQKVAQDQAQLNQADQQLAQARAAALRDRDQNQAKVASDQTRLAGDQADLASLQAAAVNPGTTYTALPWAGQVVSEDQPVYSIDGVPVPLLYGPVADYRAFQEGMSAGADVAQLNQDLIALGYGAGLTPGDSYSAATAAAVERWQQGLGIPVTGTILLGQVVFEPGPIRITTVSPSVGQNVAPGDIIDATSTTPVVTVALDVTQEYLVKPGDAVSVVLPDGTTTVGGRVQTVGAVAVCPNGNGNGAGAGNPGPNNSADQTPCSSSGGGSSSTPTVEVTVTLDATPPGTALDQAPVDVDITTQRADHVLAVPVDALLALQGGGFGVDVVTAGGSHLVGVTTGIYSRTLVQVTGSGIGPDTVVEVPSS